MMESSHFSDMQTLLGQYINFDFIDQLSAPKRKRDGHYYATYLGLLRPEYTPLAPWMQALVIKEIMPVQAKTYNTLSTLWSPYLETVYGVLPMDDHYIALNEFIRKPSSLYYPNDALRDQCSLSLEDYVNHFGCLSEPNALIFMIQLCEGLEILKKYNIVHSDIAPQNILLTDRFPQTGCPYPQIRGLHHTVSVKIIDFDIAREQKGSDHLVTAVEGTRLFAAPEILDYQTPTDRVDIYSLGCILSYMLTGKSPKQLASSRPPKGCHPRVWRIVKKSTMEYSLRYHSVTLLKQDLQTAVKMLYSRNPLHKIPGFHAEHPGVMCITAFGYTLLVMFFVIGILILDSWIEILGVCLFPIFLFDLFRLGELSYTYAAYSDRHPWVRVVFRLILGLFLPIWLFFH